MTDRVLVHFDAIAQRWEIALEGVAGATVLEPIRDGVAVGRDETGRMAEVVVDLDDTVPSELGRLPAFAVLQIAAAFGAEIASAIARTAPSTDIELAMDLPPSSPVTAGPPVLAGEPGIPERMPDGTFRVAGSTPALELRMDGGVLSVATSGRLDDDATWVRVSDAGTGGLLAIGALGDERSGRRTAVISFGLDRPAEQLHILRTARPLDRLPTRAERRMAWSDALVAEAGLARRTSRRADLAARAEEVARALGDPERLLAAQTLRRDAVQPRRRRRMWGGIGAVLVVALASGIAIGRAGGGPKVSTAVTTMATTVTTSAPGTTAPVEPVPESLSPLTFLGPAQYRFRDINVASVTVLGDLTVEAGSSATLQIRPVLYRHANVNGPDEATARRNCLSFVDTPFSSQSNGYTPITWSIAMQPVQGTEGGSFGLPPFATTGPPLVFSADAEECTTSPAMLMDTGLYAVSVTMTVEWALADYELAVPAGTAAGRWQLQLADVGGVATPDQPIVLEVVAS